MSEYLYAQGIFLKLVLEFAHNFENNNIPILSNMISAVCSVLRCVSFKFVSSTQTTAIWTYKYIYIVS
jgi:hypothetical protein